MRWASDSVVGVVWWRTSSDDQCIMYTQERYQRILIIKNTLFIWWYGIVRRVTRFCLPFYTYMLIYAIDIAQNMLLTTEDNNPQIPVVCWVQLYMFEYAINVHTFCKYIISFKNAHFIHVAICMFYYWKHVEFSWLHTAYAIRTATAPSASL